MCELWPVITPVFRALSGVYKTQHSPSETGPDEEEIFKGKPATVSSEQIYFEIEIAFAHHQQQQQQQKPKLLALKQRNLC